MKSANRILHALLGLMVAICMLSQPTRAASVLTEDFEDGNWNAFSGADLAGTHSAHITDALARAGGRAVRFDLLKNDPPLRGGTRAELVADEEVPRQERWYGFSIYLPGDGEENYVVDRAAEVVAQWHNIPDEHLGESWTSPPLALLTRDGRWLVNRNWDWDPVTSNDKIWAEGKHESIDLGAYQRGAWTDWAFHVRWGWFDSHAPLLEIYRNGTLVYRGTGPNTTNDQRGVYFKMGLYKWAWSQGLASDTVRRVIYHDEVRFADAAGSLQAVSPSARTGSSCPAVAAGQWRSLAFPQARGAVFTASATLTPGSLSAAATWGLAPSSSTGWNALAANVLFADNASEPGHPLNSILVRDGTRYRADQVLIYEAGRRYHVRMVVDPPARRYSVYVTPEGGQTVALATNYAFRDGHQDSATLTHWVIGGSLGGLTACGLQNNGGDVACGSTPPGSWRNVSLGAPRTAPFTASLTVTPEQLGAANAVGLSPATATTWDGMSATVLFSDAVSEPNVPANSIVVRDYDRYRADRVLVYEPGRRYLLRFDVDPARHRYSVYATPENGHPVLLASDYRFRQYHETVTALNYWTFAAANSTLHACAWNVGPAQRQCRDATPAQWQNLGFATQSGVFEASADVVPSQLGAAGALGFAAAPAQSWSGLATTLLFSDNSSEPTVPANSILVRDGDGYRADAVMAYQPNQTYGVRMQVDLPRQRYSVFVKPPGGNEVRLASDYRLRMPASTLSYWTLGTGIAPMSACMSQPTTATTPQPPAHVQYGWLPPVQYVGGGSTTFPVPAGKIHQTAWNTGGGPDIEGVYTAPWNGWEPMIWRWADTMRSNAITRVAPAPGTSYPSYRFELTPQDHASPGTAGDHPRAEFFSVDPAEDRRQRVPPRSNIIRQGDEYWATMAVLLPADFPANHRWATLLQRKFQNGLSSPSPWFTLNVHKGVLDMTLPRGNGDYQFLANLADIKGRWTQITLHEIASSNADGLFEVYMNGRLVARKTGPTLDPGDINYNFHLGYYRANEPASGETQGPGIGVVYETPLLIRRGPNAGGIAAVPVLP
jgi:hypothetical protein